MQQQATFSPIGFGTNDVQIMAGTFDEFTFDDVVQVLGLSRQCLRLLVKRGEAAISEVLLKAGQVLDARMPASSDPDKVFQALSGSAVRGSGLSFAVFHTEPTGPFPDPRARLSDIHARLLGRPASGAQRMPAPAVEPTLRITPQAVASALASPPPAPVPAAPQSATAATAQRPDITLSGGAPATTITTAMTMPLLHPDTFGRAIVADLQPVLRQEMNAVLDQVREHSQALHTMDGRLQALPQLVAAEIRLALAQHDREHKRAAPPPAPAPVVAPAPAAAPWSLVAGLGAGLAVLLVIVLVLAARLMR